MKVTIDMAKMIKEMSKDALTKFEPALRCSHTPDGEKIEHYTWGQMLSMYELGANAVLKVIEEIIKNSINYGTASEYIICFDRLAEKLHEFAEEE